MLKSMEPLKEQIAPEIIEAIIVKATASGLSINDYLARLLELSNGHDEDLSLSGTPFENVEDLLGVFDSRESLERPERERDAFEREVIAKLERQGLKLP